MLHEVVEILLNVRSPGGSKQAAVSQGSRAKLRGSLKPRHDFAGFEQANRGGDFVVVRGGPAIRGVAVVQDLLDLLVGETRSPIQPQQRWSHTWFLFHAVPGQPC